MLRPRRILVEEADAPCWTVQHLTTSRGLRAPTDTSDSAPRSCAGDAAEKKTDAGRQGPKTVKLPIGASNNSLQ